MPEQIKSASYSAKIVKTQPGGSYWNWDDQASTTFFSGAKMRFGNSEVLFGSDVPAENASPGSVYFRSDGSASKFYINSSTGESGSVWGAVNLAGSRTYAEILQQDYSATEVWPLVNISSGTTIGAFIDSDHDGTLSGWSLQESSGPVTGTCAPQSDGENDYGTLSLSGTWAPFIGSAFGWINVPASGWTDSSSRRFLQFNSQGVDLLYIEKASAGNIRGFIEIGSPNEIISASNLGWTSVGITWSDVNDASEWNMAVNGITAGSGTMDEGWSNANLGSAIIGGSRSNGASTLSSWLGHMAYAAIRIGASWTTADFLGMHNAAGAALGD